MGTKWVALLVAFGLAATAVMANAQEPRGFRTGPAVGQHIPDFEAVDQHGDRQTFDSLKGPNGLLLVFVRSADW